jgi:hypothetical protein
MAVNKVDIYVSKVIEDLNSGLTWLKKDDLGYGSIEERYNANPVQIATIRKHPLLKDAETNIVIFNVVDDLSTSIDVVKETTAFKKSDVVKQTSISPEPSKDDVFAFNSL